MELINEAINEEMGTDEFIIDSDNKAEWAIKKVKAEIQETDRLNRICDEQIAFYQQRKTKNDEQFDTKTGYLKHKLADYFEMVPKKETKTQLKYSLISGDLILKKSLPKYELDEPVIMDYLTENNKFDYIKTNPKVDWASLKKNEDVTRIPGVNIIEQPDKFEIK